MFEDYRDVGSSFQTGEIVGRVYCYEAFCLHFRSPRMSFSLAKKDGSRDRRTAPEKKGDLIGEGENLRLRETHS